MSGRACWRALRRAARSPSRRAPARAWTRCSRPLIDALHSDPIIEAELRVPQQEGAVLAAIEAGMVVHTREYEGNLVRLTVSGPASLVGRLRKYRLRDEPEAKP